MARAQTVHLDDQGRLHVPAGKVVVRMYRQGLGDCFLLAFGGRETRFILIDCGVHARQDNGKDRLAAVLANLREVTGGKLAVVVATHEHADHLSGFVQKDSPFLSGEFQIDQLWLAWTEKVGDPLADRLRLRRATARNIVERAVETATQPFNSLGADGSPMAIHLQVGADFEQPPVDIDIESALQLIADIDDERRATRGLNRFDAGVVADGNDPSGLRADGKDRTRPTSNELALGVLQAQAGEVMYCLPGEVLKINGVDQVRIHVLGPPHDEAKLKKDAPTAIRNRNSGGEKFKETYLSTASQSLTFGLSPAFGDDLVDGNQYPPDLRHPFDRPRRREVTFQFPEDEQFDVLLPTTRKLIDERYLDWKFDWRRIDTDWLAATADLALNLDSDTNNTSLVLAFECGERVLLFVGDAQVGNWLSWRDQDYQDERGKASVSIDELLRRTVLYKVGHHGSHNATLKRDLATASAEFPHGAPYGLELMRNIIAMIPVDRHSVEKSMPNPWEMPHQPLYERLRDKAQRRVLRADAEPNIRPLPDNAAPDLTPLDTKHVEVPDLPAAEWRRSEEVLSSDDDPLFYEIVFAF